MSGEDLARALLEASADFADPTVGSGLVPSYDRPARLATVDPAYSGAGAARVTFDGESVMTTKSYPYSTRPPAASGRVVMLPVGRGYVILGEVAATLPAASTTVVGGIEVATPAEVQSGAAGVLAVTAADLAAKAAPWWEGTASATINNATVTGLGNFTRDAAASANDASFISVVSGKPRLQPGIYEFVVAISLPTTINGRGFVDLAFGATIIFRQTWGATEDTGSLSGIFRVPSGTQDLTLQMFQTSGASRLATSRLRIARLSAP